MESNGRDDTAVGHAEDAEQKMSDALLDELKARRPDEEERERLLGDHEGHLVRHTTSKRTETEEIGAGMVAEKTAEIPDTYCFTCEEWVGLSGADLRGTPRSKTDAFYLGGMSKEVRSAKQTVVKGLDDLIYRVKRDVGHINSVEEAREFVATELEGLNA